MRWDDFFADLEHQLASERAAENAALATESERLRISRVTLITRLRALSDEGESAPVVSLELIGGVAVRGRLIGTGSDCVVVEPDDRRRGADVLPVASIRGIGVARGDLVRSAGPASPAPALVDRVTFGFVARDLARRRAGVSLHRVDGSILHGTIDRAGADHLDLALHDPGAPRRRDAVTGHRIVPFAAIACVRVDSVPAVFGTSPRQSA